MVKIKINHGSYIKLLLLSLFPTGHLCLRIHVEVVWCHPVTKRHWHRWRPPCGIVSGGWARHVQRYRGQVQCFYNTGMFARIFFQILLLPLISSKGKTGAYKFWSYLNQFYQMLLNSPLLLLICNSSWCHTIYIIHWLYCLNESLVMLFWKKVPYVLMVSCKTAVTPELTHWSYWSRALSHWFVRSLSQFMCPVISLCRICCTYLCRFSRFLRWVSV